MNIQTIDEVIATLDNIILECETNQNPLGYFPALYKRVTQKVKEGIASGLFDDGSCMEKLDVAFAKRYLDAWFAWRRNEPVTESWQKTFELSHQYRPIVLQHLLMGMNAHINLDLGIAAAEISKGKNPDDLQNDFNRINEILSSLVHEVEDDLSLVWPALKLILKHTGKVDDYLVDFSMKLAREGAWKFALSISEFSDRQLELAISERDRKVAAITDVVLKPGFIASLVLWIVRITEKGSVAERIQKLKRPV
jgi:hypothetical protein